MSKLSELDALITDLRDAASAINAAATSLAELFSANAQEPQAEEKQPQPAKAEAPKPPALSEVRAILAEKSRAGYTAQIKALLLKYGSDKLSGIDPAKYAALLAEAEVLGNG